jgi:hypothetical protein
VPKLPAQQQKIIMAEKANVQESTLYKKTVAVRFFPDSHIYMVNGKRKTGVTTYLSILDKSRPLVIWATELAEDYLLDKLKGGPVLISEKEIYTACSLHAVKKEEAANIGTEIHDWAERYIRHKLKEKGATMPEMPERKEVQIGAMAFLDWEKEHKVKFVSTERVVYSKKHDFIGKMDIEAIVDGDLVLVDLKSSNGLYNSVCMQTAAYVKADEEESGRDYKGRWAIRLSKETESEYLEKWAKKNAKRESLGKDPIDVPPYQVFEAKYLDDGGSNIDRDYKAFLSAMHLFNWNKLTDFFTNR